MGYLDEHAAKAKAHKAWLESLKVGDTVAVLAYNGYGGSQSIRLHKLAAISTDKRKKKEKYRVEWTGGGGMWFDVDGEHSVGGYSGTIYLREPSDEVKEQARREHVIARIQRRFARFESYRNSFDQKLTTAQLVEMDETLDRWMGLAFPEPKKEE
jgi:hypothetical protein